GDIVDTSARAPLQAEGSRDRQDPRRSGREDRLLGFWWKAIALDTLLREVRGGEALQARGTQAHRRDRAAALLVGRAEGDRLHVRARDKHGPWDSQHLPRVLRGRDPELERLEDVPLSLCQPAIHPDGQGQEGAVPPA